MSFLLFPRPFPFLFSRGFTIASPPGPCIFPRFLGLGRLLSMLSAVLLSPPQIPYRPARALQANVALLRFPIFGDSNLLCRTIPRATQSVRFHSPFHLYLSIRLSVCLSFLRFHDDPAPRIASHRIAPQIPPRLDLPIGGYRAGIPHDRAPARGRGADCRCCCCERASEPRLSRGPLVSGTRRRAMHARRCCGDLAAFYGTGNVRACVALALWGRGRDVG